MNKSNCHIEAWQKLRAGRARFLCIRFTEHSKVHAVTSAWWWMPLRILGICLQWLAWPLTHVGEFLRTGRWYHATWIVSPGRQHYEYVPHEEKRKRVIPPVLLSGKEQEVGDD